MSRDYQRDLYEHITHVCYPLKLSSTVMQLLALKMVEIDDERQKAQKEHDQRGVMFHGANGPTETVPLDSLSPEDQEKVVAFRDIERRYRELHKWFYDNYAWESGDKIAVKVSDARRREMEAERSREYEAIKQRYNERVNGLKELAKKLVAAQIAQVKVKVPADLMKELEEV